MQWPRLSVVALLVMSIAFATLPAAPGRLVASAQTVADGISVSGDFRGSGRPQIATLYDPGDEQGLRIAVLERVGPTEALTRSVWFAAGAGSFDVGRMKVAAADVDGDGRADLAVLYDDGGTSVRLLVFRSTGSGFAYTGNAGWWRSAGYAWSRTKAILAGRFSAIGRAGLLLVYQYDGFRMRIHYLESDGTRFLYGGDQGVYDSGPGQYDTERARFAIGHFTRATGPDQVAALYQYPNFRVRIHVFDPSPAGLVPLNGWAGVYDTGEGQYDLSRAKIAAADLDGDGRTDIASLYGYADGSVRVHVFAGAANLTLAGVGGIATLGPGRLDWATTRLVAGDWDRDGKGDLATLAWAADGTTHAGVLRSGGAALTFTPDAWVTPADEASAVACAACWPIAGLPASGGAVGRRPRAGKIDNAPLARPQYGLAPADMVFELLAEGNITRFAAMFQRQDPGVVGPVRSARFSDRYTTPMVRGALAYSGASTEITALIRQDARDGRYLDLDANDWGPTYYIDPSRPSPHGTFTTGALLRGAANTAGGTAPVAVPRWGFLARAEGAPYAGGMLGSVSATSLTVPYRADRALVTYRYDAATRSYARWQNANSVPVRTIDAASGAPVAAKTVVVVYTDLFDSGLRDSVGSVVFDMRLTGTGPVTIFRNGLRQEGTWSRPTVFDAFAFSNRIGERILLAPGQTWIHIIPTDWAVPSS